MNTFDLTPLYRSSVGFDRLGALLESAFASDGPAQGYPPYNVELLGDNHWAIALAVAGFKPEELDIQVEKQVLTIRGRKLEDTQGQRYLYRGIATRAFERKFTLAEYVEVTDARLVDGLLTIELKQELPEAMKPRTIAIGTGSRKLERTVAADKAA